MSEGLDPFDVLRERAQVLVEPTAQQKASAHGRLERAIVAEAEPASAPRVRWGWRAVAAFAIAAALVVVAVPALRTSPAQAALAEVAQAARRAAPVDIPAGNFITTTSEQTNLAVRPGADFGSEFADTEFVAYLLPTTRQVWRQPSEQFVMIQTSVGEPAFFDDKIESAYYAASLDETDQVGETYIEQFTDVADPIIETNWPTDPAKLRQLMKDLIGNNRGDQATNADLFILASNILREANPSPELRGAVIQVLAGLPITLVQSSEGSITLSLPDGDQGLAMTLSKQGHLLAETTTLLNADPALGAPAGTILTSASYGLPKIVNALPSES